MEARAPSRVQWFYALLSLASPTPAPISNDPAIRFVSFSNRGLRAVLKAPTDHGERFYAVTAVADGAPLDKPAIFFWTCVGRAVKRSLKARPESEMWKTL